MNKTYAKKNNKSIIYPFVLENLRKENSELSLPEDLSLVASDYGIFEVVLTEKPQINELTQTVTESIPVFVNDHFVQTWSINEKFDETQKQIIILEQAKQNKLAAIESEWMQLEQTGWDCGQGHLGITANDVALLSGCHALGKEADALGLPIPSIVTMENNEITFTTMAQFTQLMLQYGAYRAHLSSTFAARRRAVTAATTLEELESIP